MIRIKRAFLKIKCFNMTRLTQNHKPKFILFRFLKSHLSERYDIFRSIRIISWSIAKVFH